jgi:ABC-type phosphate/phosphonate transport system ATPase subunit
MVTPDLNETVLPFNELDTAFVHTQQTLISRSILLTLLTHNENIMVFGPSGSSKTSFLKATLKDIKILKAWLNMNMKCNSRTLAEVMERAMGKACISQDKEILGKTQRLFTGPILSNK